MKKNKILILLLIVSSSGCASLPHGLPEGKGAYKIAEQSEGHYALEVISEESLEKAKQNFEIIAKDKCNPQSNNHNIDSLKKEKRNAGAGPGLPAGYLYDAYVAKGTVDCNK